MPEEWDDDDSNENTNVPKALRDHLKKVEAELKQERESRAKLEVQVRQGAIKDVLTSQGYSSKIAAIVPPTVEANEESLKAWLDQHSDIFPKASTSGEPAMAGAPAAPAEETGAPAVQDRMGAAIAAGLPPDQVQGIEAQIDRAQTAEELDKVMEQYKHVKFRA